MTSRITALLLGLMFAAPAFAAGPSTPILVADSGRIEDGDEFSYPFLVSERGTLRVHSDGPVDLVGHLEKADGTALVSDDDSGEQGNFDLSYPVSPGKYQIRVHAAGYRGTGDFKWVAEFTPATLVSATGKKPQSVPAMSAMLAPGATDPVQRILATGGNSVPHINSFSVSPSSASPGQPVTVTLSASDDGNMNAYVIRHVAFGGINPGGVGAPPTPSSSNLSVSFTYYIPTNAPGGMNVFRAEVGDSNSISGNAATYAIAELSVNVVTASGPSNASPNAVFNSGPTNLEINTVGTWQYSVSDTNGDLAQWSIRALPDPQSWSGISGSIATAVFNHAFAAAGSYQLQLDVKDQQNATGGASYYVSVSPPPGLPTAVSGSIAASSVVTSAPGSATITWSTSNATSVAVSGPGLSSSLVSGSQVVSGLAAGSYTYTLVAQGPGGPISRTAVFSVGLSGLSPTIGMSAASITRPTGSNIVTNVIQLNGYSAAGNLLNYSYRVVQPNGTNIYGGDGPFHTDTNSVWVSEGHTEQQWRDAVYEDQWVTDGYTQINGHYEQQIVYDPHWQVHYDWWNGVWWQSWEEYSTVTVWVEDSRVWVDTSHWEQVCVQQAGWYDVWVDTSHYDYYTNATPVTSGSVTVNVGIGSASLLGKWTVNFTITTTTGVSASTSSFFWVVPPVPTITSGTTAAATVGVPFNYTIAATNSPTSYNAANLPPGLSVNPANGAITGTPTQAGPFTVSISATNDGGTGTAANLNLTIGKGSQTITFAALSDLPAGTPPITLSATAAFSSSGLPLTFAATGPANVIDRTITLTDVGPVTITASQPGDSNYNAAAPVSRSFSVTPTVPSAPIGLAATDNLTTKVTVTWQAADRAISYDVYRATTNNSASAALLNTQGPITGLTFDDNSAVPGTTYYYWAMAKNDMGYGIFSNYDTGLRTVPPPAITSMLAANATYGTGFSYAVTATNVPTSYAAAGLPAGLIFDSVTGAITGAPTQVGAFNVALTATNPGGTSPTATLVLTISKATPVVAAGLFEGATVRQSSHPALMSFYASDMPVPLPFVHPTNPSVAPPVGGVVYTAEHTFALGGPPVSVNLSNSLPLPMTAFYGELRVTATFTPNAASSQYYTSASKTSVWVYLDDMAPSIPGNVHRGLSGPTSVSLDWAASSDASGGPSPTYEISLDNGATVHGAPVSRPVAGLNGLDPGTPYQVRVRSIDAFGNRSAWSDVLSLTTPSASTDPSSSAPWIDVNGDGIRDEIFTGDSEAFIYGIEEQYTEVVTTTTWSDPWFSFSPYENGYYFYWGWVPSYPISEETYAIESVRPRFSILAEKGYGYAICRAVSPTQYQTVLLTGVLEDTEASSIQEIISQGDPWPMEAFTSAPLVLARLGKPLAGLQLDLGPFGQLQVDATNGVRGRLTLASGITVNASSSGTTTVSFPASVTPGGVTVTSSGGNLSVAGTLPGGYGVSIGSGGDGTITLPDGLRINVGSGTGSLTLPGGLAVSVSGSHISLNIPPGTASTVISGALDMLGRVLGLDPGAANPRISVDGGAWKGLGEVVLGSLSIGSHTVDLTDDTRGVPQPTNIISLTLVIEPPPMTKKVANGDVVTVAWGNAVQQSLDQPVYAGDTNGDLVEWSVTDLLSGTYSWTASGPTFATAVALPTTINGPSGPNRTSWRIANDQNGTLNWKPGTYRIKCHVDYPFGASKDYEYDQIVGWRTANYQVIGQVRPISDFVLTSTQRANLKSDLISDLHNTFNILFSLLFAPALADDATDILNGYTVEDVTTVWFAINSIPSLATHTFPNIGQAEKMWMVQYELNQNPDTFDLGSGSIDDDTLTRLHTLQSYRMYGQFQVKYILAPNRAIDRSSVTLSSNTVSIAGPTKFGPPPPLIAFISALDSRVPGFSAVFFTILQQNGLWNGSQFLIPADPNPNNNATPIAEASGLISHYTSARISFEGQNPNKALLNRDVPWIFNEIILGLDSEGKDHSNRVSMSVNKTWNQGTSDSGGVYFNEIRIYRRDNGSTTYTLQRTYAIGGGAGMLSGFINSVPDGVMSAPPTAPIVHDGP